MKKVYGFNVAKLPKGAIVVALKLDNDQRYLGIVQADGRADFTLLDWNKKFLEETDWSDPDVVKHVIGPNQDQYYMRLLEMSPIQIRALAKEKKVKYSHVMTHSQLVAILSDMHKKGK